MPWGHHRNLQLTLVFYVSNASLEMAPRISLLPADELARVSPDSFLKQLKNVI